MKNALRGHRAASVEWFEGTLAPSVIYVADRLLLHESQALCRPGKPSKDSESTAHSNRDACTTGMLIVDSVTNCETESVMQKPDLTVC
jgi:hypothetical protein